MAVSMAKNAVLSGSCVGAPAQPVSKTVIVRIAVHIIFFIRISFAVMLRW